MSRRFFYPEDQIQRYLILDIILCVFFFYHILRAESPIGLPGTFLLLALFLASYFIGLWYRDWRLLLAVFCGCGLLTIFAIFYNEWILLFGVVYADFLGRARSKVSIPIGMAGIIAMYMLSNAYLHQDPLYFLHTPHLPMLIIQLIIPIVIYLLEGSKLLKMELASAQERIATYTQAEERHRLARDLHDTLGQTLTMIKVKSELALRLIDRDPERAKQELEEVKQTSRFALKQVRDLVTSLRYVSLEDELQSGHMLLTSMGIHMKMGLLSQRPNFSKLTETMLALSLREALTNIVKHSQAKVCAVSDQVNGGWYQLSIEDDGVGLPDGQKEGYGLASIQERMRLVRGKAVIDSAPGQGVRVTLSLPIQPGEEGEG